MVLLNVNFESFVLEINAKPFHTTNVTVRLLVFQNLHAFLTQFGEFVDDGSWENFEDNFLGEDNVQDLTEESDAGETLFGDRIREEINIISTQESRIAFETGVD